MKCVATLFIISLLKVSCLITPIQKNGEIDVASLSNHVLLLEQMYSGLSSKYEAKLAEVDTKLNARLDSVNAELTTIKTELQKSKVDLQTTNATLSAVKSDLQIKSQQLINITSAVTKIRTPVSFEATLITEHFMILDHEVLKFDNIIMNEGNGYSKSSGIFSAPTTGTYLFWVHIFDDYANTLDIHIIKEGKEVVRAYATTTGTVASATALIHLMKGEQVWFEKNLGSSQIYGHNLSSYGGILLFAN